MSITNNNSLLVNINNKVITNKIPIDLHCHSIYSDGAFSVQDLLNMAKNNGSKHLALTDHDTVDGIKEAKSYANTIGLHLISGVEISVTWNEHLIHIIGLNVDENNQELLKNLETLQNLREIRGREIAKKLANIDIPNALEGAMQYCRNIKALSRTHFLRFLVANGYAKEGRAFDKYLSPKGSAYVKQQWASLKDAVTWIINSGGIAIIAHPCRYKFTRTKLFKLIAEFKSYGGIGIEVISSCHSYNDALNIAQIAKETELLSSLGSDFHNINNKYNTPTVGINYLLPAICNPIYNKLNITID